MTRYLIDFWLDGYDTDEEREEAEVEYIAESLNFSASSIKVIGKADEDSDALRMEVDARVSAEIREANAVIENVQLREKAMRVAHLEAENAALRAHIGHPNVVDMVIELDRLRDTHKILRGAYENLLKQFGGTYAPNWVREMLARVDGEAKK